MAVAVNPGGANDTGLAVWVFHVPEALQLFGLTKWLLKAPSAVASPTSCTRPGSMAALLGKYQCIRAGESWRNTGYP